MRQASLKKRVAIFAGAAVGITCCLLTISISSIISQLAPVAYPNVISIESVNWGTYTPMPRFWMTVYCETQLTTDSLEVVVDWYEKAGWSFFHHPRPKESYESFPETTYIVLGISIEQQVHVSGNTDNTVCILSCTDFIVFASYPIFFWGY